MKLIRYLSLLFVAFVGIAANGSPLLTANEEETYVLTVLAEEGGTNPTGSGTYAPGTEVNVSVGTATNFTFDGWYTDKGVFVSATASFKYTTTAETVTLVAHFRYTPGSPGDPSAPDIPEKPTPEPEKTKYRLTLLTEEGGTNVTGGGDYADSTLVNISVSTATNFTFTGWYDEQGVLVSATASFQYQTTAEAVTLTARFRYTPGSPGDPAKPDIPDKPIEPEEPDKYELALQTEEGGSSLSGAGEYEAGAAVKISVSTAANFTFAGWWSVEADTLVSASASYTYTMPAKAVTLEARFQYTPGSPGDPSTPEFPEKPVVLPSHTVSVTVNPSEGGSVSVGSSSVEEGKSTTITASASTGFVFTGWYSADTLYSKSSSASVTMGTEDMAFEARFNYNPDSPGDPSSAGTGKFSLYLSTMRAMPGRTVQCPVYLNTQDTVTDMRFHLTFPAGTTPDMENIRISGKAVGYTLSYEKVETSNVRALLAPRRAPEEKTDSTIYAISLTGGKTPPCNTRLLTVNLDVDENFTGTGSQMVGINQISMTNVDGSTETASARHGSLIMREQSELGTYYYLTIISTGSGTTKVNSKNIYSSQYVVDLLESTSTNVYFLPDEGYHLHKVLLDGEDITNQVTENRYLVSNISNDMEMEVMYAVGASANNPLTITASGHGTVTYNNETVNNGEEVFMVTYGDDAVLTVIPETGYHISSLQIDGTDALSLLSNDSKLTIESMTVAKSVAVSFEANVHSVTFTYTDTIYSQTDVAYGDAIVAPEGPKLKGHTFTGWTPEIPATMPDNDLTFTAQFTINQYTATFTIPSEGWEKVLTLDYGAELTAPTPPEKPGYTFAGWDKDIPTSMPDSALTLTGSYTQNFKTLTITATGNGAVTYGETAVRGTSQDFDVAELSSVVLAITPDTGYHLASVLVNGTDAMSQVTNGTLTIESVTAAMTILVGFAETAKMNQYQIQNGGFEDWDNEETNLVEPTHWNSYKSASGAFAAMTYQQLSKSDDVRSGATGKASVRVYARNVFGIVFQGNITTGRINYGSSSAADNDKNYNWTQTDDVNFNQPFVGLPDVMRLWVKSSCKDNSSVRCYLHTDGYFQDPMGNDITATVVAKADNSDVENSEEWKQLSIPFVYNVTDGTRPAYALVTMATSGQTYEGSTDDWILIDDVEFVYNSELTTVKFKDDEITVNGTIVEIDGTYDDTLLTLVSNGRGATITKAYNADSRTLTVNVIGDDISVNPTNQHVYSLVFSGKSNEDFHTLTLTTTGNGAVTYEETAVRETSQNFDVLELSSVVLAITPDTGYHLASVLVNGTDAMNQVTNGTLTIESITEAMTVAVNFEANVHTVTFAYTDTIYSQTNVAYGETIVAPEDPKLKGHTFAGWTPEIPATMPDNDLTFTAQFTINQYTATFTIPSENWEKVLTLDYGAVITPPDPPVKQDYAFVGWDKDIPVTMPDSNLVFTGSYTQNIHSMRLQIAGRGFAIFRNKNINVSDTTINDITDLSTINIVFVAYRGAKLHQVFVNNVDKTESVDENGRLDIENIMADVHIVATFTEYEEQIEEDGYDLLLNYPNEGEVTITKADDSEFVTIPSTVEIDEKTWTVTTIADGAFAGNTHLITLYVPASIKTVGKDLFEGCIHLAAITWEASTALTEEAIGTFTNHNLLLYTNNTNKVKFQVSNVIDLSFMTAESISLHDTEGYGDFYCPKAFTAKEISYSHDYKQETKSGKCQGWESLVLPFDVVTVKHAEKGEIYPFAILLDEQILDGDLPFWLYEFTTGGQFVEASAIKANTPYILSMPNEPELWDIYKLNGQITFQATNVLVQPTSEAIGVISDTRRFCPNYRHSDESSSTCFLLNVGDAYGVHAEGSVFSTERSERRAHPFEAYFEMTNDSPVKEYMEIFENATGLERMRYGENEKMRNTTDAVYNLNGQKVNSQITNHNSQLRKGIYIINGKLKAIR